MRQEAFIPPFETLPISQDLKRDLRSDHAGECGAVEIYRGVLATAHDETARRFARRHLRCERRHRRFFDGWLPPEHHSRLLPLWRAAGWVLGAFAGLLGASGVYRTVAAVEAFVDRHYAAQIDALPDSGPLAPLRRTLASFRDDELSHHDEAVEALSEPPSASTASS